VALRCDAGSWSLIWSRADPAGDKVTDASWCSTLNEVVVPACAAEGHVTAARLSSTTLSARHQVENRWNMLLQATCAHARTQEPTTLHSQ